MQLGAQLAQMAHPNLLVQDGISAKPYLARGESWPHAQPLNGITSSQPHILEHSWHS
jgi:hypothetical protein